MQGARVEGVEGWFRLITDLVTNGAPSLDRRKGAFEMLSEPEYVVAVPVAFPCGNIADSGHETCMALSRCLGSCSDVLAPELMSPVVGSRASLSKGTENPSLSRFQCSLFCFLGFVVVILNF